MENDESGEESNNGEVDIPTVGQVYFGT